MSPVIEVTVSPQGETQITTSGFVGGTCLLATWTLERALGLRQREQLTPEAFQTTTAEEHVVQVS